MVRNVFVLLLVFICAIYIANAFPDLRLNSLKKWMEEDQVLDRVERGFGGRGRPRGRGRGRGRPGGRGGGRGGRRGGRPGGRGRGGGRGDSSAECDNDGNGSSEEQQVDPTTKPPTTKPPTTTTTTTTTTSTTTTTTTPKPPVTDPLDVVPVDDAEVAPGDTDLGCILGPNILMAPKDIDCAQVLLTGNAGYFAHTKCGWYCQCGAGSGGAQLQQCQSGQAWDSGNMNCTPNAYEKC